MKKVQIYVDGSCLGNPGVGGWGAVLIYNGHQAEISGNERDTTNNRMELTAAIEAIRRLKEPCIIDLYTDSMYVKQGISEWIDRWRRNEWRNRLKQPIKNVDLWRQLDLCASAHQIHWHWVKGHAGHYFNEIADQLATGAAKKIVEE